MTKKEKLLQDIDYAIKCKNRFFIKRAILGYKGLVTEIFVLDDLQSLKNLIKKAENDNLTFKEQRIVSWGEFSVNETKYIKDVVLGNDLGEDIYD